MKLNYRAIRSDRTTLSDIRSAIYNEDLTIADLRRRMARCEESRADYISRLSQAERLQLVADNQALFPTGLPTTNQIPYVDQQQIEDRNEERIYP
jgi:hypothetical protein